MRRRKHEIISGYNGKHGYMELNLNFAILSGNNTYKWPHTEQKERLGLLKWVKSYDKMKQFQNIDTNPKFLLVERQN